MTIVPGVAAMSDGAEWRTSDESELASLRYLSQQFRSALAATAEIARLEAQLTLPKPTIHVISDVHGEYAKLRHVVNNASGTLRPLIERTFQDELTADEIREFVSLVLYPRESLERLRPQLQTPAAEQEFAGKILHRVVRVMQVLGCGGNIADTLAKAPTTFRPLFLDLLQGGRGSQHAAYVAAIVRALTRHDEVFTVIRQAIRLLRNMAIDELVLAGDCWDRGPRGDRVLDYLSHLPKVTFTWGNHDVAWLGACLGHLPLIANVLRISARYRRFGQLEEGYGISLQPLEQLVRACYADDPAECYLPRGSGRREKVLMARMHKAAAIMQFKLEGQIIARRPEYGLGSRRLLHTIDRQAGTIEIDGCRWPLRDTHFPTLDAERPYELSPEEATCLARIRQSFLQSQPLWAQMRFLVQRGSMVVVRDDALIFHGCLAVDDQGNFQDVPLPDGPCAGREMFRRIEQLVPRVLRTPSEPDLDFLWYLWCGPRSPLFGKDRITTLENDLIAAKETHVETKNPYFRLIHEVEFCDRVLDEFGVDRRRGLIVNGHVPVKIDAGESPLKRSGKAVTIDGAFSEAYGDRGYTLLLEPDRILLAEHHHFDSVAAAVDEGVDIIPSITLLREESQPRLVAETEQGQALRGQIALLERLIAAYQTGALPMPAGE